MRVTQQTCFGVAVMVLIGGQHRVEYRAVNSWRPIFV